MFPDNTLAVNPHIAGYAFPVKTLLPEDKLQDWEMGGVALNDPSQGLEVQLWKFTLEVDEDTGDSFVYVEAPSVAKTLLFSLPAGYISEIAGAFDQNMNPIVAYQTSGAPKIWWWDPTVPGMTHTAMPSGCIDMRVSLDDKRRFNVDASDIILSYVRGGSLYYRYQRERYLDEHLLQDNISRLVCSAMNRVWCFQWRALGEGTGFTDPYLGDIVYDLCRQAGIAPENIDVSELYDPVKDRVPGLLVDSDDGLDKPIQWLMDMFQFDKVEHGRKLRFIKRGRPVVARIPFNKLVDDYPKTLKRTERDRAKLPRTVNINHIDPDGGFAKNKQSASRRTNMSAGTGTKNIDSRVVLKAGQAADAALRKLKILHNEYEDFEFSTRLEYSYLTPGDVVEVEDFDGTWYRVHLTERNEDDGNIKWDAETDGGYLVYDNIPVPGKPLDPPVSTTPGTIGETELDIFNLPVNRDTDDELVLYVGARGGGSGWDGAALYASPDGGTSYADTGVTIPYQANIGETVTAVDDDDTSVEVLMPEPLASASSAQLDGGQNRGILGDEEVQWETATLLGMVDGLYHYNLTGLRRGVLRTDAEPWGAGIRFAEFNDAIVAVKVDRTYYGQELFYKAVSFGGTIDEATALSYMFTYAASQTEWAGTDVEVVAAPGGGVTVTWVGAPRLGTFGPNPYHSKYMIGYRVKFSDDHTIDTTEQTATYAAGLMGTPVEVRALNAITGEGPVFGGEGEVDPGDISTFGFSGSFPKAYYGLPYRLRNGDHGISMSGGYWDANARGVVVPGVGAMCGGNELSQTIFSGIPSEVGTFTTKIRVDASAPGGSGSGSSDINVSVEVLPRPTHGALDLRYLDYSYYQNMLLEDTTPPWKKFAFDGPGTLLFYGVDTGKVVGQFIVAGATNPAVIGIDASKGEMTGPATSPSIGVERIEIVATNGTYSVELDADTGDYWIYKDGSGLVDSGTLALPSGNLYRIFAGNEWVQNMTIECNGGNEAWFMSVTQAGHGGIPVPAHDIQIAWAAVDPDYSYSLGGDLFKGCVLASDFGGGPARLVKANVNYSSGKHWWLVESDYDQGICVAAFNSSHGELGSPGSPNSVGYTSGTLKWCFGGVDGSASVAPLNGTYPNPMMALDADADTLKVFMRDHYGSPVLVYTLALPAGQTWQVAAIPSLGAYVNREDLTGPAGYSPAVV